MVPSVRTAHRTLGALARLASLSALCVMIALVAEGAGSAEELYRAALAREQGVRVTLAADRVHDTAKAEVRRVVAAYQEVVRRFPTSGYSDNALWQAGVLSLDAFTLFNDERDKVAGFRLLRLLASEYPSSGRAKEVPVQLARVDGPSAATPAPLPRATEPQTPNEIVLRATAGQRAPSIATIKSIRRDVLPDAVRITIELDREVTFRDERIGGPARVFVDLPYTRAAAAILDKTLRFDGDNDIVRQIRIGRHPGSMTRVVLDGADVSSYSVYPMYQPYRLVIDCVRVLQPALSSVNVAKVPDPVRAPVLPVVPVVAAAPVDSAAATPAADKVTTAASTAPVPVPAPPATAALPPATVAAPPAAEPLPAVTSTTAPPRNLEGYSMARQLGLSVSRIVIDPGHGGHDPGAKGNSLDEAELVLDVALRVEQLLQKDAGVEVILTRRTDEFVPLPERTAIANREGADLFLSIHANASPNASARGVETYFLNFATNMSAASVAARENAASGQSMGALPDFLKAIALNNKIDESRDFAAAVQTAMVERLRRSNKALKDLGVKQAPFVVLIGAAMPSVLAEISFLTNTQEAKLLRANGYRQRIAEALVIAIRKYQSSLKKVPRVAQQ